MKTVKKERRRKKKKQFFECEQSGQKHCCEEHPCYVIDGGGPKQHRVLKE
jgi:hypothetical protein